MLITLTFGWQLIGLWGATYNELKCSKGSSGAFAMHIKHGVIIYFDV